MSGIAQFWTVVFAIAVLLFLVVEVVVVVGGAGDIVAMVRSLVGCLIAIGEGRRPVAWAEEILRAGRRDPGVTVAHAHGLTLEEVAEAGWLTDPLFDALRAGSVPGASTAARGRRVAQ